MENNNLVLKAYRPDIDGLRAVAVLSVIVFHLFNDLEFFGYVGVDIFFVISGFLITGVIYSRIRDQRFSLQEFYLSRIKRIIPAAYIVVITTFIVGLLIMLPADIKSLSKSVFSTVFSSSNIYFWYSEDSDYFARSSETMPLLHTWSLGVEEQFYFIWPFLLLLLYRFLSFSLILLFCLAVIVLSYWGAESLLQTDHSFAYYMLPTRAGELLVGAVASLLVHSSVSADDSAIRSMLRGNPMVYELMASVGALLIFSSLFLIDSSFNFPGINAIYPCVGAALIIYAGSFHETFVSKMLAVRPMVWIGLLSYSLYLWHWPILAFLRYLYVSLDSVIVSLAVVAIFCFSYLSYRLIEQPLRRNSLGFFQAFIFYFALPSALLASASFYVYLQDGLQSSILKIEGYAEELDRYSKTAVPAYKYDYVCQTNDVDLKAFSQDRCVIGKGTPKTLLWGDSNAAHFVGFMKSIASEYGYAFRNLQVGNCPPVFAKEVNYAGEKNKELCRSFREKIEADVSSYDRVLIGAAWEGYGIDEGLLEDLTATINTLIAQNIQVVLFAQVPSFKQFNKDCELRNYRFLNLDCTGRANYVLTKETKINSTLVKLAADIEGLEFYSLEKYICPDFICSAYMDGEAIYYDAFHLNIVGSSKLGALAIKDKGGVPDFLR